MKEHGVKWFATVTTVTEALAAESAGADAIVAQGMEAGGHRGSFNADDAARSLVGLFALLPAVVDAVHVPVVATGGIADARGIAAALVLGASAVQIGTGLLRAPEADIAPAWAEAIGAALPEGTVPTRAFSGRLGRSIRTAYTEAAEEGPRPAPYPIQRNLTKAMRGAATGIETMQAWAGQSARLARAEPAAELVAGLWDEAQDILQG
jgi:nitronate monooxygenase